jgi:small subunit ribosomal protein S1
MTEENLSESQSASITPEVAAETAAPIAENQSAEAEATFDIPAAAPEQSRKGAPIAEEPIPASEEGQDGESFADALKAFESTRKRPTADRQLQGTVISLSAEQVFLDVGYKMEGVLPRSAFENNAEGVKAGDKFPVSITGRNEEGYYQLSRHRVAQPKDWSAIERAFNEKVAVAGTVSEVIKGGLSVDIGVRAFMPASRSGTRDAAGMEALVGQQIHCRITKLDVADEDVVVDRRVVLEEQARGELDARRATLKEGETIAGTVRTLMPYGAFVEIAPSIDGLLHVSDISRTRIAKPEDVLSVGQEISVRILKIDSESGKISLGLKQLEPEPWETAASRYLPGARVAGTVVRLTDFGAFVEIEPGVEGLIHVSEISWNKKVRHPKDMLKVGERVEAVILSVKPEERRIALGLKQALADPWLDVERNFPVGSEIEGPVTKLMNFGAFVEIAGGIEGLVHISEMVADRRLNHPSEAVREGQRVRAQILAIDTEKRQIKLSMKQLLPTSVDEFIAEQKVGDRISGRVVELTGTGAIVELGEGIRCACRASQTATAQKSPANAAASTAGKPDLSQLSSLLKARWKGNAPAAETQAEPLAVGQVRAFKIVKLDAGSKKIEVDPA